ncbi:hypothetical protein L873DRAFT_1848726 [Choiromyces venosus 120613-1]|uniref:Uncharacterized protein n=1 Tax=Choiromyces venosus 120613-1 TaxID=1336337 RepID=A0A3N4IXG1_9PEZI|nr:hypothetical protein L873DRAFT_1848726 [Choiromyces venosus 120613-1]
MSNRLFEDFDCETEDSGDDVTVATGVSTPQRPSQIPVVQSEKANRVLVAQTKRILDTKCGGGTLSTVIDTYLLGREWAPLGTHHNNTSSNLTLKLLFETSLETTAGSEIATEWDVAAAFSGLSIDIGGSQRNFTYQEVGHGVNHTVKVPLKPGQTLTLYQRFYRFETVTWFIYNNGRNDANLGWGSEGDKWELETMQTIHANETICSEARLSGVGSLSVPRLRGFVVERILWLKMFETLSRELQEYLRRRGVKI